MRQTSTGESDLALVRGFIARDPEAVEAFSKRLRCIPLCLRALNTRAGRPLNEHDLADVVQDTTMLVLKKIEVFDGRGPLDAWAYRLCQLELFNAIRRKRRSPHSEELETLERLQESAETWSSSATLEGDVRSGLDVLSESEREIVRLKHFGGLTFDRIAERLNISANTAKTRYYRGLKKLQQFMEPRRTEQVG